MISTKLIVLTATLMLIAVASEKSYGLASKQQLDPPEQEKPHGFLNIRTSTGGGKQFWTDTLHFHGWRIQQNAYTKHYRLLDDRNRRYAWGNFAHCQQKLEQIKRERELPAMTGKAVILLHGLGRSRGSMKPIEKHLREHSDYQVFNVSYASTRNELANHARSLDHLIRNLDGIEEISFVAHSMGNLVIRHYLADQTDARTGRTPDPRIKRIVMIAPPNNGAKLARTFKDNHLFKVIWGKSGKQLASQWEELEQRLATPSCQFAVIAGNGSQRFSNPLVKGADDLIVSVEETRLVGARDFQVVEVIHSFMMQDPGVNEMTLRFLRHGHLVSENQRQPITQVEWEGSK